MLPLHVLKGTSSGAGGRHNKCEIFVPLRRNPSKYDFEQYLLQFFEIVSLCRGFCPSVAGWIAFFGSSAT
jgi:hypothetical protein